ncbi:MAG: hypothetical protein H0W20_14825 [Chthoniobacterales bacterium]|nr:hypothetical protein [Chthoniobacterales bacterium]
MRLPILVCTACAAFLTSCAYEGVIVQKDAQPLSLYHTAGVEGSYAFLLRDNAGTVRRQIVTPEVYNQYAIGEYFNDLQPATAGGRDAIDSKVVKTASNSQPKPGVQLAAARKVSPASSVAAKPAAKPTTTVAKSTPAARQATIVATKPAVAATRSAGVAATAPVVAKAGAVTGKPGPIAAKPAPVAVVTKPAPIVA